MGGLCGRRAVNAEVIDIMVTKSTYERLQQNGVHIRFFHGPELGYCDQCRANAEMGEADGSDDDDGDEDYSPPAASGSNVEVEGGEEETPLSDSEPDSAYS